MQRCRNGADKSGFVCPLWTSLRHLVLGLREVDLALATTPAEDSCSFRAIVSCACGDCTHYAPTGQAIRKNALSGDKPGYDATSSSQLAAADAFIDEHPGQVKVISLEIGGADLQGMAAAEPLSSAAESAWAGRLADNYVEIVSDLRQSAPTQPSS